VTYYPDRTPQTGVESSSTIISNRVFFQGLRKRDLGINTESPKELLEGREQIYACIITSISVFSCLRLRCQEDMQMGSEYESHMVSRMAMPVNIVFSGGND
jgi:hypothetical protein